MLSTSRRTEVKTVADMMAELRRFDPSLPVKVTHDSMVGERRESRVRIGLDFGYPAVFVCIEELSIMARGGRR